MGFDMPPVDVLDRGLLYSLGQGLMCCAVPSVGLSVCLSVFLSCLSLDLSVGLSASRPDCLCLSMHLPLFLSSPLFPSLSLPNPHPPSRPHSLSRAHVSENLPPHYTTERICSKPCGRAAGARAETGTLFEQARQEFLGQRRRFSYDLRHPCHRYYCN